MKKILMVLMAVILVTVSSLAFAEGTEKEHSFVTFEDAKGTAYDMFCVTKLNYGEDHKVTSVTGHFERVAQDEEGMDVPETAPDSEKTYPLAPDFKAEMIGSTLDYDMKTVEVTDLYQWYIAAYLADAEYDGRTRADLLIAGCKAYCLSDPDGLCFSVKYDIIDEKRF